MKYLPISLIVLLLVLILGARIFFSFKTQVHFKDGQAVTIRAKLASEPTITGKSQRFSIKKPGFDTVFISTSVFPTYHYGDRVEISGKLKEKVLENNRRIISLSFPWIQLLPASFSIVRNLKRSISHLFLSTLPPTSGSLLLGIVFGSKEAMPKAFLDQLQLEGLTHVIAASGMNVSMVAAALLFLSTKFLQRKVAIITAMLGIFGYSLLTGFEPSIMRASIMSLIGCSALLLGRQQWAFLSIVLTAYVMVFLNPFVISDLGFQLSFLSTIGIMYIKPMLDRLFHYLPTTKLSEFFTEDLTTTTAAQLATIPLLLVTFGTYNLLSVISNLLVLWTIPFLMVLGGLGALIGLVFPLFGKLFLFFSLPLLLYFQKAVELTSHLIFMVQFEQVPWLILIGYYGLLVAVCLFLKHEKTSHT